MMSSYHPIRCCDRDCALVNGCQIGGVKCDKCGRYECAICLDENGLCEDCAAENEEEGETDEA